MATLNGDHATIHDGASQFALEANQGEHHSILTCLLRDWA
jgi:hypothetical protein